jgi:hypothetical protein
MRPPAYPSLMQQLTLVTSDMRILTAMSPSNKDERDT